MPFRGSDARATADWRRVQMGLAALLAVMALGTVGYVAFGFTVLEGLYQTVTTVTTVGFREVQPLGDGAQVFTIVLILVGVGTALYTLSAFIETLLEGQMQGAFGRQRMERKINGMRDHVIICGWGRVGRAIAKELDAAGQEYVVVDADDERLETVEGPSVLGDATADDVLEQAGVRRARALVAALDNDAGNLFVTLSARSFGSDLFIVGRVRIEDNEEKLRRAGADRVINPQSIGGARAGAFLLQPHVTEFLDVVMHDAEIEFRLEEVKVPERSALAGASIRDAHIRDRTGALVLAVRQPDHSFITNPAPEHHIEAGQVLIVIGTKEELAALDQLAARTT
ncbi:MAG TPA: potassium channel protein [Acidimicrobiia bacterium]|nr:potassium channel protein [Acidimicrobiia bacterium]